MVLRGWVLLAALALAALPAEADAKQLHRPPAAKVRPRAFASCTDLVGYAGRHFAVTRGVPAPAVLPLGQPVARPVPAPGTQPPSSAPEAQPVAAQPTADTTFSTTNNQEEGVDEPDIVKTDGTTIFAVAQGRLFAVAAGDAEPKVVGSLDLGPTGYGAQLLLRGSRLIVISGAAPVAVPVEVVSPGQPQPARAALAPYPGAEKTVVTEVDVHDPAAMKVARTMAVDGRYVDARQNGATARVVISSPPRAVADAATRAQARGWVPARRFRSAITGRHYVRPAASCRSIRRPAQFSGLGMLTILTVDLDRGLWAADSDDLMADAQVVYGSPTGLYVATQKWIDPETTPGRLPDEPTTVIHRFDVSDPDRTTFASSGEVRGYLLNQFSLSEDKGHLRAATTSRPVWWPGIDPQSQGESLVTVLDEHGSLLVPVGQVAGLGKGQQIYSVRFLGDAGYVVTFRRIDPLYTIDLSSPTAPRVAGQLELEGYSAYLHPVGPGLLLGIGRDVSAGAPSGAQVELFDVSDAAAPKLLQRTTLGAGSSSEVEYDHHAFLFWARTRLAVLPVQTYDRDAPFAGAIGYRIDRSGIAEAGRVEHEAVDGYLQPIRRSIVIGRRLFTVSEAGTMASDLDSLGQSAFVAFPKP
ncbi:MAG TPA: beta-propeller domain-containing protein [Solirubrobacteraceae bacterium]